jgi:MATE family multidrug resistance protein
MIWMLPGMVIKSFTEARHHPWPVFWLQIAGVGINIVLNYLWIFGHGGFPAMGLAGAGMATFVARLFTLIGCGLYLFRSRKWSTERPRFAPFHRHEFLALLSLAAPITAQMLMEFGAFAFGALMIGRIGSLPLAAHQIALTCAATSYMIPLGISTAAGIRIGHVLGAGAQLRARRIYWSGQCVTVLIMGGFGLWFYFGGTAIARAFTPDPELIGLTARLLVIAGMFQLFDGTQVMSVGALRAMRDVKIPTLFSLAGYWGIAVPLGLFLGFGRGWGVLGFWTGLATGLGLAALTLTLRAARQLRRVQEQPIEFPQLKHL